MKLDFLRSIKYLCPYTHIWRAVRCMFAEKKIPATARQGALIALLGLSCPLFWIAYFSGASREELVFHGLHSAMVFVVGIILFLIGIMKDIKRKNQNRNE
ncbi:hypothetical protein [Desulfoplanes formicivorans]|uniref:hypothetical protein n=1 Tax=Desulfoplanes formicivorans TaxID=1592317 RepID=UPI00085339D7|nr:hypothetical protein [Desulfoplanes formicivorans]